MRARRVPFWGWWIALVMLLSAPWFSFIPRLQWDRVNLIPFGDPTDKPRDFILNVGLFVPFGFSFLGNCRGRRRILDTIAAAGFVSVCAEATQVLSTLRHPSTTDVLAALLGAVAGGWLRLLFENNTS